MAIELQAFRAFVAGDIGNGNTVTVGNADKTQLAQTRYTGDRPLASRTITQVETSQDNIYVRSQLLSVVRDALGGEEDAFFVRQQEKLLGISATAPQADLKLASKALTVRDVRETLAGLDARLAQRTVKNLFDQRITASFGALHDRKFSARNLELVRGILQKEYDRVFAANPRVDLGTLTGPGSLYALLLDRCRRSTENNSILLATHALSPVRAKAFLRACASLVPTSLGHGFDMRLLSLGDRLEKITDFSPAHLVKLIYPEVRWPADHIPKNVAALDERQHSGLMHYLQDMMTVGIDNSRGLDEQDRQAGRLISLTLLFNLGLSITEIRNIAKDPARFNPANLPAAAFLVGVQGTDRGLEAAFEQTVMDLTRTPCTVSIPQPNGRPWTLPAAATVAGHPFAATAQAQLRTAVEAFCGPRASESMKANIFLFMSQSAQSLDCICNGLLNTGRASATKGYHYAFASEPDGSVVVTRSAQGPHTFEIGLSIRFRPDGSQELAAPVGLKFNLDVTTGQMQLHENMVQRRNLLRANVEMDAYLEEHLYNPVKALLDEEITEILRQYPVVQNERGALEKRARNILSAAFKQDPALCARFLAQTPEERTASLPEIKARFLESMVKNMTACAVEKQMVVEAEAELRQAAGEGMEGVNVDLKGLTSEFGLVNYAEMSIDEMRTRFQEVKGRFVARRTAVINHVRNLQGVGDSFRATLLEEVLTRPRVDLEGLQIALELAQGLNLPPATWKHDSDSVKLTCYTIARAIQARFTTLDRGAYTAEQKGNMASIIMLYLMGEHRAEMQNLLQACTAESLQQVQDEFSAGGDPDLGLYSGFVTGALQEELAIAAGA